MASQGYNKDKLQKMMAEPCPKLMNCSDFRQPDEESRCPSPPQNVGPGRDLMPWDLLKNKNNLYTSDGKQGLSKDKTKTNNPNWKQKRI